MKPRILKLVYEYLCKECRYNWVYENKPELCGVCSSTRFIDTDDTPTGWGTLSLEYKTETSFVFQEKLPIRPAIVLLRPYTEGMVLPHIKEQFEDYTQRVIPLVGRFFTPYVFIPFYIPELNHAKYYQYYYIGKPTTTD